MFPKYHIVLHMYDIHCIIGIILFQVLKDLQLYPCLVVILLLILNHLQCHFFLSFMIKTLYRNPKRTLPKELHDFIPIPNMILNYYLVVPLMVIIAKVVLTLRRALDL
jgi:hypothetical protein